ncbi:hypothetical protein KUTeg_023892 [Tegillarca granosa]|uniref:Uncharacterized protein n=1 Tax=Tegillarca granosa TaxID=220873 RepID=A0ABQ9DZ25_TEGGR|nr:hypothetical protein KUTeg_023892 [Tegillarca granosa]
MVFAHHMLNLKDYVGKTLSTAPYTKSVKAKVICAESARSYFNEKGEGRQMKVCVVGDRESTVELISYDHTNFHFLCPGNSLVIRNFIPKEDNIVETKNSKVMITSDVMLPKNIIQTGNNILFPPPPTVTSFETCKNITFENPFRVQSLSYLDKGYIKQM